ncbi:MAG: glycosyltransferase family 39 protein [Sedimentisphaerales bacterium]
MVNIYMFKGAKIYTSYALNIFSYRYFLFWVLLIGGVLHLLIGFYLTQKFADGFHSGDSDGYIVLSRYLANQLIFFNAAGPEVFRTPGYPLILSIAQLANVPVELYVLVIQNFMLVSIAYFCWSIVRSVTENLFSANLAAFLVMIDPLLFLYQYKILSEIPFLFFITWSLQLFITGFKENKPGYLFISFVLIGVGTFVRPISLYFPYVLIAFALISFMAYRLDFFSKRAIVSCLCGFVICIAATLSWQHRNLSLAGSNEFAAVSSYNLISFIVAPIVADSQSLPPDKIKSRFDSEYMHIPQNKRTEYAKDKFVDTVLTYPASAIKVFIKGVFLTMLEPGIGDWLNFLHLRTPGSGVIYLYQSLSMTDFLHYLLAHDLIFLIVQIAGFVYILALWFGAVSGLTAMRHRIYLSIFIVFLFYFLLVSSSGGSYSRFRIPIEPLLICLFSVAFGNRIANHGKLKSPFG